MALCAGGRRFGLIAVVLLFGAVAAPTVLEASTDESLEQNVQASEDANAARRGGQPRAGPQRLGAIGAQLLRSRGTIMPRASPLLYVGLAVLLRTR